MKQQILLADFYLTYRDNYTNITHRVDDIAEALAEARKVDPEAYIQFEHDPEDGYTIFRLFRLETDVEYDARLEALKHAQKEAARLKREDAAKRKKDKEQQIRNEALALAKMNPSFAKELKDALSSSEK